MRRLGRAAILGVLAAAGGCGEAVVQKPPSARSVAESAAELDDADYLLQLGLMRGHLLVGNALFELGEHDAARMHSKHPADELYAALAPSLAARGSAGFAAELDAHAASVAAGDEAAVAQAYATVVEAIDRTEKIVEPSPRLAAQVILLLLREAAREYAVGIVAGKPENPHEYQDAYGFARVALDWSRRSALRLGAGDRRIFERMADKLEALDIMWPSLMPPRHVEQSAARLYVAAADMEILALDLGR